jgi:hypothetical protein
VDNDAWKIRVGGGDKQNLFLGCLRKFQGTINVLLSESGHVPWFLGFKYHQEALRVETSNDAIGYQ